MIKKPSSKQSVKPSPKTKKAVKVVKKSVTKKPDTSLSPILILATVLFLASFSAWWLLVRNNPERIFSAMLNNSLRTNSATRIVKQDSGFQSVNQLVHFQLQPEPLVQGLTDITQSGEVEAQVITESIDTNTDNYVRYIDIDTGQTNQDGDPLDYSELLDVWGHAEVNSGQAVAEIHSDVIIPFSNLSTVQRRHILDFIDMQSVYNVDYDNVVKVTDGLRQKYDYTVEVRLDNYVRLLQEIGRYNGISQFNDLNHDQFVDTEPLTFIVRVDVLSRRLDSIRTIEGERTEKFKGYGVYRRVETPSRDNVISIEELQQRVQAIQ